MKPFHCRHCNRPITMTYGLCHDCADRVYRSNSLFLPSLSKKQRYTKTQKPICIICGKVCERLGSHLLRSHKMTLDEYKKKFKISYKIYSKNKKKHLTKAQKSDTLEIENTERDTNES